MSLTFNSSTTAAAGGDDDILAGSLPDWDVAIPTWGWAWPLHNYTLGILFLLLSLHAGLSLVHFHRRICHQRFLLAITLLLLAAGASRGIVMFVDSYSSIRRLPLAVSMVLQGLTFPCLTSAFALIQMAFMRVTKVKLAPPRLQNFTFLSGIICVHFTMVICVDVIVSLDRKLKVILILCQSAFIIWGLFLCGAFVYSGFKMTQFTNETKKALQQLSTYNRYKQQTIMQGGASDIKIGAMHRIMKPKIRITDDENKTYSYPSDGSSTDSSNTLSYVNEGTFDFSNDEFEDGDSCSVDESYIHISMTTEGESEPNREISVEFLPKKGQNRVRKKNSRLESGGLLCDCVEGNFTPRDIPFREMDDKERKRSRSFGSTSSSIFTIDSNIVRNDHTHSMEKSRANANGTGNGHVCTGEHNNNVNNENPDEVLPDSGYMADTEHNSPEHRGVAPARHDSACQESPTNSPEHDRYKLQNKEGKVSLYRIRQGRTLHKVVKVTYGTTLLAFMCCVLQLYSIFGVYGVLAKGLHPEPWPWYIFQTCFR